MQPLKNHTITDAERRELVGIAQKILDVDNNIYRAVNLKNFQWQVREFFLWDALICMLTSLTHPGFFSRAELDANWAKLVDVWAHHPELLETWRPVHVMAGRAILEAWATNPPTNCEPEPYVIATLKARRDKAGRAAPAATGVKAAAAAPDPGASVAAARPFDTAAASAAAAAVGDWSEASLSLDTGFQPGVGDFVFWDQFFLSAEMNQGSAPETGQDYCRIHGTVDLCQF